MPKITCNRSTFKNALQSVSSAAIKGGSTLASLGCVQISAKAGLLRMMGTDLDLSASVEIDCDTTGQLEGGVTASLLSSLANGLSSESICFESDGGGWILSGGKSKFKLPVTSWNDLPPISINSNFDTPAVSASSLNKMFELTRFCAGTEEARSTLTGVFLETGAHGLSTTATDTRRMAKVEVGLEGFAEANAILPPRAVTGIQRLFRDAGELRFCLDESQATFATADGKTQLWTRLFSGPYVNYEKFIPTESRQTFKFNRAELQSIAARLMLLFEKKDFCAYRTEMDFIGHGCRISASGDYANGVEEMDAESVEGFGNFRIAFNGQFLSQAMFRFDCKELLMDVISPTRVVVIRDPADTARSYKSVIGPLAPPS